MVTRIARVCINRVRLPILHVVSWTGKMHVSLSSFAPENLVSRDGFGSPAYSGCFFLGLSKNVYEVGDAQKV